MPGCRGQPSVQRIASHGAPRPSRTWRAPVARQRGALCGLRGCATFGAVHRIVVDAMGGDQAPDEIVKGAAEASLSLKEAELILVGDAARIGRILPQVRHDGGRVRVHHAPSVIAMDEKPSEAIAAKPDSSIAIAAELVATGEGDALVSAGNTGRLRAGLRPPLEAPGRGAPLGAGRGLPDRAAPRREERPVLADPRRGRHHRGRTPTIWSPSP